jgi:Ca2+:H+ antiporter
LTAPGTSWVFLTAAVSLIPLAGLIGLGTEELAHRSGPAWGGFLNATFGNAAELIIADRRAQRRPHRAGAGSITGSILGNLLLVLGLSFFVGGLGRRTQKFHRTPATNTAALLFLAVVGWSCRRSSIWPCTGIGGPSGGDRSTEFLDRDHPDRLRMRQPDLRVHRAPRSVSSERDTASTARRAVNPRRARASRIGTVLTTVQAEILVGALQPAMERFGFTELFVGVIVIAIIGNAAEHYSAIIAARRDEMTLAVEIAVGSSAQIALFVAPLVVLYSMTTAHPMSLLFNAFEITAIALSVLATVIVVVDGESNWVEGLQLMAVYLILGLAFYFVPA